MERNFLDNFLVDRIRIQREDKNPIHVLELLNKHLNYSLDELKSKYKVQLHIIRSEITILGNSSDICELVNYLSTKSCDPKSVTENSIVLDLYKYYRTII